VTSATTPAPGQREPVLLRQTVVLIGGSAGIGLETARRARAEGADVILTGRDPGRLQAAAAEVGARQTAAFDATDPAALGRFFADLPGAIDHVMVTGPGPYYAPLADLDRERAHRGAALAVHIMSNTALTGATYDIDGGQQFVS
jgi:NADP-dependent 3-hydroxy acid dehydrogenase YdfG